MAVVDDMHVRGIAISALALAALVSGEPSFFGNPVASSLIGRCDPK
jgi:hypothetical protein